ncbi:MAG: hypothetical protein JNL28_15635 [Planctomycetes bacterium]|nr:hypothetical protein [Planctomycetota bacterium]
MTHTLNSRRRLTAATLLAAAALAGLASGYAPLQEPRAQPKPGELGYQPPEVADVRVRDSVVHQDRIGGSYQSLLALSGSSAPGFCAVWRDTRDGTLGLYFVRLDERGAALEPERSICSPHTMRRTDAVVALAPDGGGAIAWTAVLARGAVPFVRCFDGAGMILGGERRLSTPIEPGPGDGPLGGRGDDETSCREPALARFEDGRVAIVWTRNGRMQWLELSHQGDPSGPVVDFDPSLPAAEPGVRLASGPENVVAALWHARGGALHLSVRRDKRCATGALGSGMGRALVADPAGGYWILVRDEGRTLLRHAAPDGKPDRPERVVSTSDTREEQLAVFDGGLALLERAAQDGRAGGPPTVRLFAADGTPRSDEPFTIPSAAARGVTDVRIASSGRTLLIAWTDARDGDLNVYARPLVPGAPDGEKLGAEVRLNSDEASATQNHPVVAATGAHGVMAWSDERSGPARVYLRRFGAHDMAADELALPLAFGSTPAPAAAGGALRSAVAVRGNGDALVCWRQVAPGGVSRLLGQVVGLDGTARSAVLDLDDGAHGLPGDPACTALAGERGFAVAWPRAHRGGVQTRRVAPDGALGEVRRLSDIAELDAADVDIEELDGGRVLCVWTAHKPPSTWSIRGRYTTDAGAVLGDEIHFDDTGRGGDWDPALAPATGGGFVMSFTSGPILDPVRDVVVRLFDARARPKGPLLPVCFSANEQDFSDVVRLDDGSYVIAWEDDISYVDQVYARRLSADGRTLGPMTRINEIDSKFVADRVAPRIAAIGGGFGAVFADRRRSLGFDAVFKLVGPGFDMPAEPDVR